MHSSVSVEEETFHPAKISPDNVIPFTFPIFSLPNQSDELVSAVHFDKKPSCSCMDNLQRRNTDLICPVACIHCNDLVKMTIT